MAGYSTSNSHRCKMFQFFLFCVLPVFLLWGCGGDASEPETSGGLTPASTDTGSASFAVQWHTADPADRAAAVVRQAIQDCESAGVESISCTVYDESDNAIAHGGPWDCSAHHGSIGQIPAGANRVLNVLGTGAGGQILYQGQTAGITIIPGKVTDAGTIDARPFVPAAPVMDEVWGNRIDLSWSDLGLGSYKIYRDGVAVGESTTTSYGDTGLNQQTQYCYTISALDGYGNESGKSDQTCATTSLLSIWFRDSDNDSFGDPDNSIQDAATSPPEGYVADNTDCNDGSGAVHPDAEEICNGIDDNCDTTVDEGVQNTFYLDYDGDDYGDSSQNKQACTAPDGYVADNNDCNDRNDAIYPGAVETCNGIDDDCDTSVDEGVLRTFYRDYDKDNYGDAGQTRQACAAPDGYVADDTDCDDNDININPGTREVCFDGIDNNCTSGIDERCVAANEDCIAFNPSSVFIDSPSEIIWMILDRQKNMLSLVFDNGTEADQALGIIQDYKMNDQCFVGNREEPSMRYWLVDGSSPVGSYSNEDCIPFDPKAIEIVPRGEQWGLVEGNMLMMTVPTYEEAQQSLQTIQFYGFDNQCFVGRPDPPMSYWRREAATDVQLD
jgi:hypothetical protein